ncbi:MAG: PKD domain-containing protein [Candidatus Diapherotrites archaeon]|nr:PKD domain-containing protein [Candidatus Diapherotrites archaeon]
MKRNLACLVQILLISALCYVEGNYQPSARLEIKSIDKNCNVYNTGKIDMTFYANVEVVLENIPKDNLSSYEPRCLVSIDQGSLKEMHKTIKKLPGCDDRKCDGKIEATFNLSTDFASENAIIRVKLLCYRWACSRPDLCDANDYEEYDLNMKYCLERDKKLPKTSFSPDIKTWLKGQSDVTLQCSDVGVGCSSIYYKKAGVSEAQAFTDIWKNKDNIERLKQLIQSSGKSSITVTLNEPTLIAYASKDFAGNFEKPSVAYIKVDGVAPPTDAIMSKASVVFKDTFDKNTFDELRWEKTNWTIVQTSYRTGIATATEQRKGHLISKSINLAGAESAIIEFWAMKENWGAEDYLYLYFCSGSDTNCQLFKKVSSELDLMGEVFKIDIPKEYRTMNFKVKFDAYVKSIGKFRIDNISVIKNPKISLVCKDTSPYGLGLNIAEIELVSGCEDTNYRVDGSNWSTGTEFNITDAGCHRINYRSSDKAGNLETEKSAEFCVEDFSSSVEPSPSPSPSPTPVQTQTPSNSPIPTPTVRTLSISDVSVQTSANEAKITWKTSIESRCRIGIAKTEDIFSWYDSFTLNSKEHTQSFSELYSDTIYVYEIKCFTDVELKNYRGTFFTMPQEQNRKRISIVGFKAEPTTAYEGEVITFELVVSAAYPELKYKWDFGDGRIITDKKNKKEYVYYLPANFENYEKEYTVKVSVIGSDDEDLGYAEKKVTIKRSAIRVRLIKPTWGETLKKTELVEARVTFMDAGNKTIEPSQITNIYATIDGLSTNTKFDGNELVITYLPNYKTKNSTILKISAKVSSSSGKIELNSSLPLSFEPMKLILYHNPFAEKNYPINSEIKDAIIRVMVPQINQPVQMAYIEAYLKCSNSKKRVASVSSKSNPYDYRMVLDHRISEENLKQGLVLYVQGEDIYGNYFSEELRIPISKDNPNFDLELSDYNIGAVKGQFLTIKGKITSTIGLKGNVEFLCDNGDGGKAIYKAEEDVHLLKIQVPNDLKSNKLGCEAKAVAFDKNKSWVALENFSIYLVNFTVTVIEPKQGINISLGPTNSIKLFILKSDDSTPTEEEIYGKINIDGKNSAVVFKKSGGFYVANLEEPLGFGEHYLKLMLEEPYAYQQEMVVLIKQDENINWLLVLIVSFSVFAYMGFRILSKTLERRDLMKNLKTEEESLRSLIKRLKIAYMKKHISKAEFKEKYSEAILRLTKIRSMAKGNIPLKPKKR